MTRRTLAALACLLLVGCATPPATGGPSAAPSAAPDVAPGAKADCPPLAEPSMPPGAMPTPVPDAPATPTPAPFSYTIGPAPAEGDPAIASVTVDGRAMRYQAGVILLTFDAAPVPSTGPEGIIPGVLAHHALVEPLLRDFGLEVVEQSRIPTRLEPVQVGVPSTPGPSPAIRDWSVRPDFRTRVRDLAAVSLDSLQADATAAGLPGTWVFAGRDAAATWARMLRIRRTGGCYPQLRFVGPNGYATPG